MITLFSTTLRPPRTSFTNYRPPPLRMPGVIALHAFSPLSFAPLRFFRTRLRPGITSKLFYVTANPRQFDDHVARAFPSICRWYTTRGPGTSAYKKKEGRSESARLQTSRLSAVSSERLYPRRTGRARVNSNQYLNLWKLVALDTSRNNRVDRTARMRVSTTTGELASASRRNCTALDPRCSKAKATAS